MKHQAMAKLRKQCIKGNDRACKTLEEVCAGGRDEVCQYVPE
jgi:hypothetical protein